MTSTPKLTIWLKSDGDSDMTKSIERFLRIASGALIGTVIATAANATVFLGIDEGGATPTVVGSGSSSAAVSPSFGGFTFTTFSGTAAPAPDYLLSNALAVAATGAGTLNIFVTATDLSQLQPNLFLSSFGSNSLTSGFTLTERTFLDTSNGVFTTTGGAVSPLGAQTFIGGGFQQQIANLGTIVGPFSITEVYTIVANGTGNFNANIEVSAVPEPSTWAMMILGFLGVGFMAYRQKSPRPAIRFV